MSHLRLKRGPSRVWANLFRLGLVRAKLPFWRVVVEAKLDYRAKPWPAHLAGAVAGVFVWARTIEEAEALAALALEQEGMQTLTSDAVRHPPAARPSAVPVAVARTQIGYLPRVQEDAPDIALRRHDR